MLDRIRNVVTEQPWRTAAVLLAVGLVVSIVFNLVGDDGGSQPGDDVATTSTTTSSLDSETTPTTDGSEPESTTTAPTSPPLSSGGAVVGIKVDNSTGARPQVGIGQAPLLIEFPVEGGITRFTAIFSREASGFVGPVRSLRPVDADLLPAVAPIVVSSGGQPFVLREVEAAGINSIIAGDSSMFVSLGRDDPHDTFVDLGLLGSILDDSLLPAGGGLPSGGPLPATRSPALEVESPLGPASFVYEEGTGYVRIENGESFEVLDLSGGNPAPLTHDTLVFLFAAERSAGYADSNGAPVSTFDVIGSGDLLVFRDGEALQATWSRSALADGFEFFGDTGEPFGLPDGRTFLAVLSRTLTVAFN